MPFTYFDNFVNSGIGVTANDYYRDLTQAFINQQWDNTSTKTPENGGVLQEQAAIGSSTYNEIEAWLAPIVADTSTGLKYPEDFLKLVFKDIDHTVQRGLMYQYNNEYWIAYSYASFDGLPQSVGIRRCNNVLKMIDPYSGAIFSIPCCVDYDMLAPTPQVSRYIITPNSHAVVMVQGNADTNRLFQINTRFILGGRPFKLYAYQNAIKYNSSDTITSLLYLDLYLDELHADDNVANGLAYNGDYNYTIVMCSDVTKLRVNSSGQFYCSVLLNGVEVQRPVIWESQSDEYIIVNSSGHYTVRKATELLAPSVVTVAMVDNPSVRNVLRCTCARNVNSVPILSFSPLTQQMAQYSSIIVEPFVTYNGDKYIGNDINITIINHSDNLSVDINNDGTLTITANQIGSGSIVLKAVVDAVGGSVETMNYRFNIQVNSMMG